MEYADDGSLRKGLPKIVDDNWYIKLVKLKNIINGLYRIHQENLIHCDLHDGNILNYSDWTYISDLGLCQPTSSFKTNDIYGVIHLLYHLWHLKF